MRILITTPHLERQGGVASYYRVLQPYFTETVDYFIVGSRTDSECGWNKFTRFLKDNWCFYQRLAKGKYDIVHLNPSLAHKAVIRDGVLLLLAKMKRHKVVVFFRGWNKDFESSLKNTRLRLFKSVYFRAHAFVVLASEFKKTLRSWGYTKPIYVETTTFDDRCLSGSVVNETHAKSKKGKFNILFLSRIEEAKGIYLAINACRKLRNKYNYVRLTVAGDGSELEAVRNYVQKKHIECVEFIGYVTNEAKIKTFASSDVYLFPSSWGEGMPNSVLEAMACGLPIVARAVGGLDDFFQNEKMGFITKSKCPDVFANLVERLILKPKFREKIARFNQQYAKEHFAAASVAQHVENIYKSVATKM